MLLSPSRQRACGPSILMCQAPATRLVCIVSPLESIGHTTKSMVIQISVQIRKECDCVD